MKTLREKRKREKTATAAKERLLDAAQELMLSKGFAATTVDEICEAAELTKGCFFHYFESKDELGRVLLERFCCGAEEMHKGLCGDAEDPLEQVYNYIDGFVKLSKDPVMGRGCLLGTFAQELSDANPQIRNACAKGFESWARQFGGMVARAKSKYAPHASFKPEELAEHLIAILEGSLILAKTQKSMKVIEKNLLHFRKYLQTIFGR